MNDMKPKAARGRTAGPSSARRNWAVERIKAKNIAASLAVDISRIPGLGDDGDAQALQEAYDTMALIHNALESMYALLGERESVGHRGAAAAEDDDVTSAVRDAVAVLLLASLQSAIKDTLKEAAAEPTEALDETLAMTWSGMSDDERALFRAQADGVLEVIDGALDEPAADLADVLG